jgi:hypothetical protein
MELLRWIEPRLMTVARLTDRRPKIKFRHGEESLFVWFKCFEMHNRIKEVRSVCLAQYFRTPPTLDPSKADIRPQSTDRSFDRFPEYQRPLNHRATSKGQMATTTICKAQE